MLYRVFSSSLTVFFALFVLFGAQNPAFSQSGDPYLVKGVSVDVNGKSALDARNKAFAEARREAYRRLAASMVSEADRENIVIPEDRVISSLVRDFAIVNEKMTSRRYAGTLDVRFNPNAVKRTLQVAQPQQQPAPQADVAQQNNTAQNNVTPSQAQSQTQPQAQQQIVRNNRDDLAYTPRQPGSVSAGNDRALTAQKASTPQSRAILVLPWYGQMGRQSLWEQGNPWRAAWEEKTALSRDKSVPILLPVGDVEDLRDYSPPQPLSRRGNIENLLKRYRAGDAVLALAEPNSDGGVVVSLYRYENGAPSPVGRFGVDSSSRDVLGDAVAKAAEALRALPARAPAPTPVSISGDYVPPLQQQAQQPLQQPAQQYVQPAQQAGAYRALARFSGLQQWVSMRQALYRIPSITSVNVQSISPSQANIEFTYAGDYATLAPMMAQSGLQLTPLPAGAVVSAAGVPPQYLLSMGGVY